MHTRARRLAAGPAAMLGTAVTLALLGVTPTTVVPSARAHLAPRLRRLPARVYAPYVETWLPGSLVGLSRQAGAPYLTLAFLRTARPGSCTVGWNGGTGPTAAPSRYRQQAAALERLGGAVIPSFGGWTADSQGTDIADSCPSAARVARAYESALTATGATRLDLDIESRSLTDVAGLERRDRALELVAAWAARRDRPLQVQLTLPTQPSGLAASGLAVLSRARADGVRIDLVNIMGFDYYDGTTDMGEALVEAATALESRLGALYPGRSSARLWRMVGLTLLPGIDDNPDRHEVTTLADARRVAAFARARGIGALSIWAIQRDNGGCPGARDRSRCSGARQTPFAFSRVLESYARGPAAAGADLRRAEPAAPSPRSSTVATTTTRSPGAGRCGPPSPPPPPARW